MRSSSPAAEAAVPLPTAPSIGERPAPAIRALWSSVWRVDPVVVLAIAARGLGLAAGLVGSVLTARYLQPAGRGDYFLALTAAQLIAQVGNLGLQSGNTYFVARDRSRFSGLLANSIWISFVGVPVAGAALLVMSIWGTAGSTTAWFAVALAPLFVFNLLGNGLFVGLDQMKAFSLMQPVSSAIVLPCLLVAAAFHAGPAGFLAASLLAWTVTAAIMLFLLLRQSSGVGWFRPDVFVMTWRYSTKVYLATLAGFLVLRMNVFILHTLGGAEQVGYYSIASQVADTLAVLPQSMATVLFPRLVTNPAGRLGATMRDALRAAALLLVICAGVWAIAEPGIRLAFGPRFAEAVPVMRAVLPGVFFLGVTSVVSQYLAASGFPLSVVGCWLASAVLCAGLSWHFISRHGAVGAGEALSVTYAALLMAMLFLCWRTARQDSGRLQRIEHE